jgi:hypothetical protein
MRKADIFDLKDYAGLYKGNPAEILAIPSTRTKP